MQGEQVGETVGGRDAAVERTRMYSPRVSTACSPRQLKERANHHQKPGNGTNQGRLAKLELPLMHRACIRRQRDEKARWDQ
jgi:hypothetical protein